MLSENLMLAILMIAVGFAIFLLSNLQKGILIKLFGWFIAVIVMLTGIIYAMRITGPKIFCRAKSRVNSDLRNIKNSKKSSNPLDNLYKKSKIDEMFKEIP